MAARCLLVAMGHEETELDEREAQAFVGALMFVEAMRDLHIIRKVLTTPPPSE
jgi:hypothetical protein